MAGHGGAGDDLGGRVDALVRPVLLSAGFDLEDLAVTRAGARSVVRVVVDRDGGVDLDAVADASRIVGGVLDEHEDAVPGAYALEVTSPGVDRPLTAPRHWRRNLGRLVDVQETSGTGYEGRIRAVDDAGATVEPEGGQARRVEFAGVRRAVVQVEFTRTAALPPDSGEPGEEPDDGEDGE